MPEKNEKQLESIWSQSGDANWCTGPVMPVLSAQYVFDNATVGSGDVRHITEQPPLSSTVNLRRLSVTAFHYQ